MPARAGNDGVVEVVIGDVLPVRPDRWILERALAARPWRRGRSSARTRLAGMSSSSSSPRGSGEAPALGQERLPAREQAARARRLPAAARRRGGRQRPRGAQGSRPGAHAGGDRPARCPAPAAVSAKAAPRSRGGSSHRPGPVEVINRDREPRGRSQERHRALAGRHPGGPGGRRDGSAGRTLLQSLSRWGCSPSGQSNSRPPTGTLLNRMRSCGSLREEAANSVKGVCM